MKPISQLYLVTLFVCLASCSSLDDQTEIKEETESPREENEELKGKRQMKEEIESLREENKELREKLEKLERSKSEFTTRIKRQNHDFIKSIDGKLEESQWKPVGDGVEIYAQAFPSARGALSVVRIEKKHIAAGSLVSQNGDGILLRNLPFIRWSEGRSPALRTDASGVVSLSNSGTLEIRTGGKYVMKGASHISGLPQ